MEQYFTQHPTGLIDLSELSREHTLRGPLPEYQDMRGSLMLAPVDNKDHRRLFRYSYFSEEKTAGSEQSFKFTPPVFSYTKDVDYYLICVNSSREMLGDARLESFRSFNGRIRKSAEHLAEMDKQNQNNNTSK